MTHSRFQLLINKWIWCGDAYQSLFVNRYLTGNRDIERRTLLALRPGEPVTTHVNTIVDYSALWILGIREYYNSYDDKAFVQEVFPSVRSLLALCLSQRDSLGFIIGRPQDWEFVDWADFDREGALCAEQMFFHIEGKDGKVLWRETVPITNNHLDSHNG